jgi:hypothetical protein
MPSKHDAACLRRRADADMYTLCTCGFSDASVRAAMPADDPMTTAVGTGARALNAAVSFTPWEVLHPLEHASLEARARAVLTAALPDLAEHFARKLEADGRVNAADTLRYREPGWSASRADSSVLAASRAREGER